MSLDLDAYFARIGFVDRVEPDLRFLRAVQAQHATTIAFENLSTLMREPVPLDIESLQRKLVDNRRGGYCFEQNRLFATMLEQVGFAVTPLAARVVWGVPDGRVNPRTHMVLLVGLAGGRYICDVGFGGATPTTPLELATDAVQATTLEEFRLVECREGYELQVHFGDGAGTAPVWRPMYRFDLQTQRPIDYEMANHFVATHPSSHFRTELRIARPFEAGRYALGNDTLTTFHRDGRRESRRLHSVAEVKSALEETFRIAVPQSPRLDDALARVLAP